MKRSEQAEADSVAGVRGRGRVFISYSRRDASAVGRLIERLDTGGFDVLLDTKDTAAFEDWWQRLRKLIAESDTFLFVVSANSVASEICEREVKFAASLNKRIAPVVFERVDRKRLPQEIRAHQFVYMDDENSWGAASDELLRGLTVNLPWLREHAKIAAAANDWEDAKRRPGLLLRTPRLQAAERWRDNKPDEAPDLTDLQREFLTSSRKGLLRRIGIWMAAGIPFATIISFNAALVTGMAFSERVRDWVVSNSYEAMIDYGVMSRADAVDMKVAPVAEPKGVSNLTELDRQAIETLFGYADSYGLRGQAELYWHISSALLELASMKNANMEHPDAVGPLSAASVRFIDRALKLTPNDKQKKTLLVQALVHHAIHQEALGNRNSAKALAARAEVALKELGDTQVNLDVYRGWIRHFLPVQQPGPLQ